MFPRMIPIVLREIRTVEAILPTSSSMSTISAASMAASEPIEPIAIPTSDRIRAGASLIPSPAKASLFFPVCSARSFSSSSTFSPGRSSARTSSIPISRATACAAFSRSPDSMTVFRIPAAFISRTASFTPSLILSEITTVPAKRPPRAR